MSCTCPKPSAALGFVPYVSKCEPCKAADIEQHARRLGARDVARIPSPSAICALVGCMVREPHVHEVLE